MIKKLLLLSIVVPMIMPHPLRAELSQTQQEMLSDVKEAVTGAIAKNPSALAAVALKGADALKLIADPDVQAALEEEFPEGEKIVTELVEKAINPTFLKKSKRLAKKALVGTLKGIGQGVSWGARGAANLAGAAVNKLKQKIDWENWE